jgi:hypothetical protein
MTEEYFSNLGLFSFQLEFFPRIRCYQINFSLQQICVNPEG